MKNNRDRKGVIKLHNMAFDNNDELFGLDDTFLESISAGTDSPMKEAGTNANWKPSGDQMEL